MLDRVKRRELTFSHLLAHPLCNTPQHTLLVLLLFLWHQHNSSQFSPVPCFSSAICSATNAIIKSCRALLPAPTQSQQSHQWHCRHLTNPGFPFIHSSYYVQQGHHRQLYKAWKAHTAPVSEVQFIGSTEKGKPATTFSPGICWGFFGSRCWMFSGFVL